jgi:hypothetical protein
MAPGSGQGLSLNQSIKEVQMQILMDNVLAHADGRAILEKESPVTVGKIACAALLSDFPEERVDGGEKSRRYHLWLRIKSGGIQELSAEEISLIKRLIGIGWPPLVVGQAWEFLEKGVVIDPGRLPSILDESGASSGAAVLGGRD